MKIDIKILHMLGKKLSLDQFNRDLILIYFVQPKSYDMIYNPDLFLDKLLLD